MLNRVEDELRPRLLTPPADVIAAWQAAHPNAGMEFARVLDRSKFNAQFDSGVVGVRGGGAYYSFVTRSNSYDDEPTIGLDNGRFTETFYGHSQAVLRDLGIIDPVGVPANWSPKGAELFEVISKGPALPTDVADSRLTALLDDRRSNDSRLVLQHTYLLRGVSPNEHDLLAAFVPIHQDAFGITLAWRVLEAWPVPDRRTGFGEKAPRKNLAPEAWTASMSTDGLLLLLGRIRVFTSERLVAIPDALRQQWPNRPLARVLRDYYGDRFVNIDGGGRFFNFATQSNDVTVRGNALRQRRLGFLPDSLRR